MGKQGTIVTKVGVPPPKLPGKTNSAKSEMSFWHADDPKKLYRGNTDHWSKQRIEANVNLARKKKDHTDAGVTVPPHVSSNQKTMYVWSHDRQWRHYRPFDHLCMEFLDGHHPGDLSDGYSKGLCKDWMLGVAYGHAKENYEYWPYDARSPFQLPARELKIITALTSLPPFNMKRVMRLNPRIKGTMKSNVPI